MQPQRRDRTVSAVSHCGINARSLLGSGFNRYRRVAACLDALKHVSTEDLESGRVQSLAVRLADAEKQRNELLSALQAIIPVLERAFDFDGDVLGIMHNEAVDAELQARAAIAKATGEPQ